MAAKMQEVSRGLEILIKKAAVDAAFRGLLLAERAAAADSIALALSREEAATLNAIPADQLSAVISKTYVADKHRPVFMGYVAAAMIAALGVIPAACCRELGGARPTSPPPTPADGETPAKTAETSATGETAETAEPIGGVGVPDAGPHTGPGKTEGRGGMRPDIPKKR